MAEQPEDDPRDTHFTAILLYVLGFMGTMALLAFAAAWGLRHC
ncbi:MAG: hypothetical protein ACRD1P_00590 [Thermoanaerobaculia bacterium]